MLFLFCEALFVLRGASFCVMPCCLSSCFFLALWSPRLGGGGGGGGGLFCVLLVHLFVCFARVGFCPFSVPLVVALPGRFY